MRGKVVVVKIQRNNSELTDNVISYCFYYLGLFRGVTKKKGPKLLSLLLGYVELEKKPHTLFSMT